MIEILNLLPFINFLVLQHPQKFRPQLTELCSRAGVKQVLARVHAFMYDLKKTFHFMFRCCS